MRATDWFRIHPLLVSLALNPGSVAAQELNRIGFAWADQPAAERYTPSAAYAYNAVGGPVEITRTSTGAYAVRFVRLGRAATPGGNVLVTGYGAGPERCSVTSWESRGVDFVALVGCYNAAGVRVDARFSVLVTSGTPSGVGFAWVSNPRVSVYATPAAFAYNSAGGTVRVNRMAAGRFTIRFAGLGRPSRGGNAQVTAYGPGGQWCGVEGWNSEGAEFTVNVRCFDARGVAADGQFSVVASWPAERTPPLAYAWADRPGMASYVASAAYAHNPSGQPVHISRLRLGAYLVRFSGFGGGAASGGNVQVTAYGSGSEYCKVSGWAPDGPDFETQVRCYNATGAPVDARFSVHVLGVPTGPRIVGLPVPVPVPVPVPLPPAATCPPGGNLLDFESLPTGTAIANGQILTGEYRAQGATFPTRAEGVRCRPGGPCAAAHSGRTVVRSPLETEFRRYPFTVEFTVPQRSVALHVIGDGPPPPDAAAALTAYDAAGRRLSTDSERAPAAWRELCVTSGSANISRVTVTLGGSDGVTSNFILIDDLRFSGGAEPPPSGDATPPRVSIVEAGGRVTTDRAEASLQLLVRDETALARIDLRVTAPSGEATVPFTASVCGSTTPCPTPAFDQRVTVPLVLSGTPRPGTYRVTFRACDTSGNCAEASGEIEFRAATVVDTDVWVMGVEYSQGWQDRVYTHLGRGPVQGWVPLREDGGRDTELAVPIVPGKPMLIRLFVGLRDSVAGGATASPVQVTGRIVVWRNSTETPRTFRPLANPNCQDHLGSAQPCLAVIDVDRRLGRLDFTTVTEYDLDLVARRIHWGGTLNFVIPADYTVGMTGGFSLDAHVQTVGRRDVQEADNSFRISVGNANARDMNIRVVRVAMPGAPAPTTAEANRAIRDLAAMIPYSRVNVVADVPFRYGGETAVITAKFLGIDIVTEKLDQCQTLWLQLWGAFGLDRENTAVALTPAGVALNGCGGLGWRVPELTVLREAFGRVVYHGGIALSRMPAYSSPGLADAGDWDRIGTLAMEVYHAHLDRRHVSNDHGEAGGCMLTDGSLVNFAIEALGFAIDPDCWKGTTHPHGTVGTYPASIVEVGVPGNVTGIRTGNVLWGMLGGMGHRIEPEGSSYRLTLYDPCPTGRLDSADPASTLRQRIDPARGTICTLPEGQQAHDFMSYGSNGWYAIQALPNVKNMRWVF